jgi:hypothetical protein
MRVIQSVQVLTSGELLVFRVGEELNGEAIIQISRTTTLSGAPGYTILNEDCEKLAVIENCAVIVEYVKVEEG